MKSQDFFDFTSKEQGDLISDNLVFKTNIQEFYPKITYISNLEAKGYITSEEAYQQIKFFWQQLKTSKKLLKIKNNNINNPDNELIL